MRAVGGLQGRPRGLRSAAAVVAAVVMAGSPVVAAPLAAGRFGYLGLAPAEAGQTLQQLETLLGTPLQPPASAVKQDNGCQQRSAGALPGVVFIVDKGVLTRSETRDARYVTVSGVRVGDDVHKVRRVYGKRLRVTPHVYFAKGLVLAVYSPDGSNALVMESNDSGRIITVRGGSVPAVEFLEGCSP